MTENATGFQVGADINPFERAMQGMVESARNSQGQVAGAFSSMSGAVERFNGILSGGVAAVAGGAALQVFLDQANEWNNAASKMASQLGISTEKASVLNTALHRLGVDSEVYLNAAQELTNKTAENAGAFDKLGVKVKDSAGYYRPVIDIMGEVNQKLLEIKNPMEQNIAAQQVYGESWSEVRDVLKITSEVMTESELRARELGLIVGPEGVAMSKQYSAQMSDLNLVGKSIAIQFGNSLLPVFTRLGLFMAEEGPVAGQVFGRVIEGIGFAAASTWLALRDMGDGIGALAAQAGALLSGDIAGFKAIGAARDAEAAKNEAAYGRLKSQFGKPMVMPAVLPRGPVISRGPQYSFSDDDEKKSGSKGKGKTAKEPKEQKEASYMQTYDAALNERKLTFEKENTLREFSKQQELDYWRDILATYEVGSKDRTAIATKMGKLELDILRQSAKDKAAITQLRAEDYKAETLAYIEELDARASFERDNGDMSQQDYLARQQAFNAMRLQAELDFIAQKVEVVKLDPESNVVALEQLEIQKLEVKRRYAALAAGVSRDQAAAAMEPINAITGTISQSFGQLTNTMLTNWRGLGTALRGVLSSIGQSIIQETVLKPLQAKLAAWVKERALTMAGIGADAAKAGSGAAASQAGIPIIGPILAVAAMLAIMSQVGGAKSQVPSAAGGFDIPRGLNPLTQLHEEEMVLPASIANPLRDSIDAGGAGAGAGAGRQPEGQIRGMPPSEWLMVHRGDLVTALRSAQRDFSFTKF